MTVKKKKRQRKYKLSNLNFLFQQNLFMPLPRIVQKILFKQSIFLKI